MKRLGISVYPNLIDVEETIKYIDLAHQNGFSRIFTNFLEIGEGDEMTNRFTKVCQHANKLGFEVILDVNPDVFTQVSKKHKDPLAFFKSMGATGIRMDEEYDGKVEADITNSPVNLKLEINASSTTGLLDNIIKYKGNLKNIIACHNFYPQKYSGLDEQLYIDKCNYYKDKGIKVAAFVSSNNKKAIGPWPLNEGLPTLEKHRDMSLIDQIKDMVASDLVDDIIISNQPASNQELKAIKELTLDGFNFHIKLEKGISDTEKKCLFDAKTERFGNTIDNAVRQDYSSYMIRCSAPRVKYANDPIKPRKLNTKFFMPGDVLVLNSLYGRYNGEVQIVMKKMEYDKRKNLVGKISKNDIELFKYIKPNKKISFIEKK